MGRIVLEQTGQTGIYVCDGGHPALGPQQSHAWLEVGGLIVDLTHDQFEHIGLVGWVFKASSWHARFERDINELCLSPARWGQYPYAAYRAMTGAKKRCCRLCKPMRDSLATQPMSGSGELVK